MSDMKKRETQVEWSHDATSNTLSFAIADGGEPLVLDLNKIHPDVMAKAALYGIAQVRMVDKAAVPLERPDDEGGGIRTRAEMLAIKRERLTALRDHLESGTSEWSMRTSGDGIGARSLTIEAIAAMRECDYATAKAMVARHAEAMFKGDTKKALAHFRKGPKVQAAMDEIRKARMPAPIVDADEEVMNLKAE